MGVVDNRVEDESCVSGSGLYWRHAGQLIMADVFFFFFNDTATTEIYTRSIVGSVRCVQETGINAEYMGLFKQYIIEKETQILAKGEEQKNTEISISKLEAKKKQDEILFERLKSEYRREEKKVDMIEKERSALLNTCLLYTSPSPRDLSTSRMPSSA
eukprot:TRINITY_DN3004_c0_g4_i1.p1 TRINITY_DN3004_c0_g4~~TRINITY_DN3004_c0_g4_i1.p1  ORF type:complete len:158 (+),score=57.02 TRINITY_DN3004_c0_g4_i1:3-476(+)